MKDFERNCFLILPGYDLIKMYNKGVAADCKEKTKDKKRMTEKEKIEIIFLKNRLSNSIAIDYPFIYPWEWPNVVPILYSDTIFSNLIILAFSDMLFIQLKSWNYMIFSCGFISGRPHQKGQRERCSLCPFLTRDYKLNRWLRRRQKACVNGSFAIAKLTASRVPKSCRPHRYG